MAKLRKNHRNTSLIGPGFIRIVGLLLILLLCFIVFKFLPSSGTDSSSRGYTNNGNTTASTEARSYLPSAQGQVIHHEHYSLSYIEEFEQPEWVAYELKKSNLFKKHVPRSGDFRSDAAVKTTSANKADYKRSGYSRGHLVPAGDMAFDHSAMSETFFMSNMSPQSIPFNGGIWRELEEQVRDWAKKYDHLYVVSGPVLTEKPIDYIGRNDVAVPASYYKVILDMNRGNPRGIGYIIPHKKSEEPLDNFAVSIDEVEQLTKLNFFKDLMSEEEQQAFESVKNTKPWYFSDKRYQTRKKSWNNM